MNQRTKRILHYWLSIPGAIFILLWIASGVALVCDSIRGGLHAFPKLPKTTADLHHLKIPPETILQKISDPVTKFSIYFNGMHAYAEVTTPQKMILVDGENGEILSPLNKAAATQLFQNMAGVAPDSVTRITQRNYEYKYGELPAWRAVFSDGRIIHISEQSGQLQSWSDKTGMKIRAAYYYFHAFQFTDSPGFNAAIGFFAMLWAAASLLTGILLYVRKKTVVVVVLFCLLVSTAIYAENPPHRIVSLAPSCTEILAGLGLSKNIVGITQHTDYPPEVAGLPVVGSYVNLNLETIISLNPDLVVATDDGNPKDVLDRLREMSIPVIVLNLRTYGSIETSIISLGHLVQRESEAKTLVNYMKAVAGCISARTLKAKPVSVLFAYESYPIVTAGQGTFTDQLVQMSGGTLITHDVEISYPTLTIENVIAKNPEVIIESSMDPNTEREQKLRWWNQWPMIDAVNNHRVYVLNSNHLDRPSQRIVYGFSLLAQTLHPELFSTNNCLGAK